MYGFVIDEKLRKKITGQAKNYWDVYLAQINDLIGACGTVLSLDDLNDSRIFETFQTLVIGSQSGDELSMAVRENLKQWVAQGGLLIGFGFGGMDEVFGIKSVGERKQTPDDYTIAGYFDLRPHPLTFQIHPIEYQEQKLLVFSDVKLVELAGAVELAHLYDATGKDLNSSVIHWNEYGKGFAGYFAFDLAKTIWILHEGKPLGPPSKEMPYPRAADKCVIGNNSRKVPYADELCFILQNMMANSGQPFIHQIPPEGETIPDAMLYWGGDEYMGPTEYSLKSSDWLSKKGIGYHINMMDIHPITPEELKHIVEENGHEVGQYYGLHEEDNFAMKEEYYSELNDKFYKKFGFRPITTVNKWLRWEKGSEPAKWMLKAGGKSDNSFFGINVPFTHPMANGPFWGFGCGTSFPFFFYEDHSGDNQRIDFLEQPIICYEIGHRGSMAITPRDQETLAIEDFHVPIKMAVKYHFVMNMFYHPVYIAESPKCREAIEGLLKYIDYLGATVTHVGNDEAWKWWTDRSSSTLEDVKIDSDSISFTATANYHKGMVVKLPISRDIARITCDGKSTAGKTKKEFSIRWLYIIVPFGKHTINITMA